MYEENVHTHILLNRFRCEDALNKIQDLLQYMKDGKASVYYVCGDDEDTAAGMLWAHPYQLHGEARMHINALVVISAYRRSGLAKQMYEALYKEMLEKGMDIVYTNVDAVNRTSMLFHYDQGFFDEMYQFVKIL